MFTNKKREGINRFVRDFSLYVTETPKASIKYHKPPLPIIPFGIVVYDFVGQPFSKQLYKFECGARTTKRRNKPILHRSRETSARSDSCTKHKSVSRETYGFFEVKLRHLRRETYEDNLCDIRDNCVQRESRRPLTTHYFSV